MHKPIIYLLAPALLFIGSACTPETAAGIVARAATSHPALIATAQADQYWRDAAATTNAYQATLETNYGFVEGTAQAATSTAITQRAQATATTQALQTRDALGLALTAGAATSQAQETATAQRRTDILATGTAATAATAGALSATRQAVELRQEEARARREQVLTISSYAFLFAVTALGIGMAAWFFWRVAPALINRASVVRYGQHGNPLVLAPQDGRTVIVDPLRMLQAALTVEEEGRAAMEELTPNELQMVVTGGALSTLVEQARHAPGHPPRLPTEIVEERRAGSFGSIKTTRHGAPQELLTGHTVSREKERLRAEPRIQEPISWEHLQAHAGRGLALGMGEKAMVILQLAQTPHILISGSSGTGKTRRILRPLVAQALVRGLSVILLNEAGADFSPFYEHPNTFFIRGEADTYLAFLEAAFAEVERREAVLRRARISEWGRLPGAAEQGPPLLIIIDEVLSLTLTMAPRERKLFWSLLASYASRARKLSMGSVGALTDPTYRVLGTGLNWREQCSARIAFRVAKASVSRAVLDSSGAEALGEGEFLAMLGTQELVSGIAANPGDEELRAYLARHPAREARELEWVQSLQSTGT